MPKVALDALDDELTFVDPGERRARPSKPWRVHKPKRNKWDVRASLAERGDSLRAGRELLLSPGLDATSEEREWISTHLNLFHATRIITGVLRRVKGGKEANVYCCAAHPDTGLDLIAAKLYRPRKFRNLHHDSQYRQGRPVLNDQGQAISQRDWRMHKAIDNKTRKGLQAQQTSWLEYEFQTMQQLHTAGADVPRPLKHGDHALLMEYLGDEAMPAPTLNLVALEPAEARPLFDRLMYNVEVMLAHQYVHGDLSAYNVLYWDGEAKIIDFPQVVDPRANPDARAIFQRDVERLCQYFARYGVRADASALARDFWRRYAQPPLAALDTAAR